ncbi:MAG: ATP-grasp domain-containing protein, partial [Lentisphaeria bacterium]
MNKISEWYVSFSDISFPAMFLPLTELEKKALIENIDGEEKANLWNRISAAISSLPRGVVINADSVAPTDSIFFKKRRVVHTAISSWNQLTSSEKVKKALVSQTSNCLVLRPYRRMDSSREFRLFIKDGDLVCASQYNLNKFFPKLEVRKTEIWDKLKSFFYSQVKPRLKEKNVVIDVYLCSDGQVLIIDFNDFGGETSPLLFRKFENIDKKLCEIEPLRLLPAPMKMGGNVSIS